MTKYVAFLRAVNVGKRIVKMEDLRQQLGEAGFKNVKTYIQSGNVMFESGSTHVAALATKIEKLLLKNYGFEVPAIIRSVPELELVVKHTPFPGVTPDKSLQVYVSFLSAPAGPHAAGVIAALQSPAETLHMKGCEVYTMIRKDLETKPLDVVAQLERKLGIPCTTRNWATVNKVIW
ncbi:DUF1697 domain-containing protein [Chitinophaga sp. 22321]|uniref:DUF1697 domain-containing protein n=1 Tax=Chitinophaga hostae TaxID=2831022 RepID=A0ABS5J8F2_9BACT|nr:DUF1697 domain-containing protein [Chitinophaga hostae]MBS0031333.1 DUF1697 domain-containing protein [Chitinophaga hostae]